MKIDDLDSVKDLQNQISQLKLLKKLYKFLRIFGIKLKQDNKKLENFLTEIDEKFNELVEIPKEFNDTFSDLGWIVHDSIDFNLMKQALTIFKRDGMEKAEDEIIEYYAPENLKDVLYRLRACPELLRRYRFIEFAYNDYAEGKYYSAIPILLMMIDGAINEAVGKGFHNSQKNLDIWDSIITVDNGISKIRDIFRTGRYKTRKENISLPFRNGILHGIDLGYDNVVVAAKCWHILFVIRDWILSKNSEKDRKNAFIQKQNPPPIRESLKKLRDVRNKQAACENWIPRIIDNEKIEDINRKCNKELNLPEAKAIEFLELWKKKNYGYLANLFWSGCGKIKKHDVKGKREQYSETIVDFYLKKIVDEAPAITQIECIVTNSRGEKMVYEIRLLYEDIEGASLPRSMGEGEWKIVWAQPKRSN